MGRTTEHLANHQADKDWLINVIGLVDESNPIFHKDYLPPPKSKFQPSEILICNPNDFWTGLPMSKKKGKLRLPQDKAKRMQMEMERLTFRQTELAVKMELLKTKPVSKPANADIQML